MGRMNDESASVKNSEAVWTSRHVLSSSSHFITVIKQGSFTRGLKLQY